MYYIHYDDEGYIISVSNSKDESFKSIETDLEIYEDFSNLKRQLHEYKVVEDLTTKGKMYLIPMDYQDSEKILQPKGFIPTDKDFNTGINFKQSNNNWIVYNQIDSIIRTAIVSGNEYIKEYYVVDSTNRYLLLDTLRVNLTTLCKTDKILINKNFNYNSNVLIMSNSSSIQHTHIIGETNASN